MGNCLVTKLKGSVNNDNLEVFNKLLINVAEGDHTAAQIRLASSSTFTVEVENGVLSTGTTTASGTDLSFGVNAYTGGAKVYVTPKYYFSNVGLVEGYSMDITQLEYNQMDMSVLQLKAGSYGNIDKFQFKVNMFDIRDLSGVTFVEVTGNIKHFIENGTKEFYLAGSKLTLNTEDLSLTTGSGYISLALPNNVEGHIKYAAHCVSFNPGPTVYQDIEGSIEELVEYANSIGRTSGSLSMNFTNAFPKVTYGGVPLSESPYFVNGANNIHWQDNTITITH